MFSVKLERLLKRVSLRTRMTALFVAIFGVTLVLSSVITYRVFSKNVRAEFDSDLFNHAVDLAQGIEVGLYGDLILNSAQLNAATKVLPFKMGNSLVQLASWDGQVLARSSNLGDAQLPHQAEEFSKIHTTLVSWEMIGADEIQGLPEKARKSNRFRILNYRVQKGPDLSFVLQVAVPYTWVEQQTKGLRIFLWLLTPLTLLISSVAGLILSKKAFAPVSDMIEKARSISILNLNERIPLPSVHDEIRRLAITFNSLLDRIQSGFLTQERFVSDASHQLRTPLAILRGELDLLKQKSPSGDELNAFVESSTQELEHLSRMVEDLLVLARVDTGASSLSLSPVRLDEVATDAVSRLKKFAQHQGVGVKFNLNFEHGEPDYEVMGDSDLLRSLLQSLVENAIQHAPQVEVSVSSEADWVWARVRDNGPGIASEHHFKLFERFYRIDGSKKRGTGLGLAIAKRIAEAHQGLLILESEPGNGSLFSFGMKRVLATELG